MFSEIFALIKKYDIITIFGHVNPDGDCYGSELALRDSLRLAFPDKQVYALGSGCHRFFERIGEMDVVPLSTIQESLAIIVDANDFPRMEDQRIIEAKAWAKIDHHVDMGSFAQGPSVVSEDANSTCELVGDMIQECSLPINQKIAEALYLGILTDTGRFQFIKDFPKAFKQVAWLCEKGADPAVLNRILNITSESSLAFKGFVYSNYQKTKDGVVYLIINKEQLSHFGLSASKAGSMVNLLSNLKGYPIWVFFCENEDGTDHIEFRSNGPLVQPIALKYGGGGHALASGATTSTFDLNEIAKIVDDLDKTIVEFQKEK